jgi:1,4-dihydroxy-2-naphthoate octaprenyltransferase
MKDTIITAKRKKTEIITLLVCFILANLLNLYAIIHYKTAFIELLTCLGYIAIATIVLYAFWSLLRIIFYAIRNAIRHPKRS